MIPYRSMTLDGIPLWSTTISSSTDMVDTLYHNRDFYDFIQPSRSIEIYMTAFPSSVHEAYHLQDLWNHFGCTWNLVALGPGHVCPYCGQYNAAGRIGCWACGGEVEIVPFIKPVQWAGVRTRSIDCRLPHGNDEKIQVDVELSAPSIDYDILQLLSGSGKLETLQHGLSLEGYYLCEFCGASVEDGSPCPYCGGYQLPWSELVKIDRDCLYCGERVEKGVVCKQCGAKLAGLTYGVVKGKIDAKGHLLRI